VNALLVGGSGYLGGLVAAGLLSETDLLIVAPIRSAHTRESVLAPIREELRCEGLDTRIDFERIVTVPLPGSDDWSALDEIVERYAIEQIIHCAGSVDYFNSALLHDANIVLTQRLLDLAKRHDMQRFVFLSTAFSSGYIDRPVREELHAGEGTDPTEYTKTKRNAEALVAASGVPYLIVRPSIVIGDSRDGRYAGKAYGLYQFWTAFERLLTDRYREVMHLISPRVQLHLLHQNAFKNAFVAACRHLPLNTIVNLTSRLEGLPTARGLSQQFCERVARPQQVFFYNKLADVRADIVDRRMRMLLDFTAVNSEISSHAWRFENSALRTLRSLGLQFVDATLETVLTCQDRFVDRSPRIQAYLAKNEELFAANPGTVEIGAA
jgi:nucleoside-diphosphate-sugar epimerase